jgi:hypothetical protein
VSKPRLIDALDTLGQAISDAINAAGIPQDNGIAPGQTVLGFAVTTELVKILAQGGMNHLVVLWPLKADLNRAIYSPNDPYCQTEKCPDVALNYLQTVIAPTFLQQAATQLRYIGLVDQPYNVTLVVNGERVLVQAAPPMLLTDVAAAVAAAVNKLGLSGVVATVTQDTVTIPLAYEVVCEVGAAGSVTTEIDRVCRLVQVITYAPNPMARTLLDDAIVQGVGTNISKWFTMSDGQAMLARYVDGGPDRYREKAQSSYSAFEAHSLFRVEYPITVDTPATQIGAVDLSGTINPAS